jgi:threonyl-tRNA synthetase
VNGRLIDLEAPLERDAELEIVTLDSKEGLQVYRHSAAHVLAQAVKRIYGGGGGEARHRAGDRGRILLRH